LLVLAVVMAFLVVNSAMLGVGYRVGRRTRG
jgi:hypothetical protein